jgi:transposase
VREVAKDLGVSEQTTYTWRRQDRIDRGLGERAELVAARRRIRELETELEIHGERLSCWRNAATQKSIRGHRSHVRGEPACSTRLPGAQRLRVRLLRLVQSGRPRRARSGTRCCWSGCVRSTSIPAAPAVHSAPVRSRLANAIGERVVRTLREEAPDHILPLSERHVRSVLAEFVAYYNQDRPHRSLGLETPVSRRRPVDGEVVSRPVLDGLHHVYERAA